MCSPKAYWSLEQLSNPLLHLIWLQCMKNFSFNEHRRWLLSCRKNIHQPLLHRRNSAPKWLPSPATVLFSLIGWNTTNVYKVVLKRSSESLISILIQNHIKKGLKHEKVPRVNQRRFKFYANEALNREAFSCETFATLTFASICIPFLEIISTMS